MASIVYGGLDVHQQSISAYLICRDSGEALCDELPNDRVHLARAVRRWAKMGELHLCYEASSAGFVVKRWLDDLGASCEIVALSLVPRAAGARVKNRLLKYLAQLGWRYTQGKDWSLKHRRCLETLSLPLLPTLIVQTHLQTLDHLEQQ